MKQIIKHKFNNRLLKLLKYKKNKYLKKFGTTSKKIVFFSSPSFNKKIRGRFIKKERLKHYNIVDKNSINYLQRKEYSLRSFLFKILFKHSKKYVRYIAGKELKQKAFFMPSKLSLTRFKINKILKSYYTNLSSKTLLNLCRKKALYRTQRNKISLIEPIFSKNKLKSNFNTDLTLKKPSVIEKKEIGKNFIQNIEQRLDSSLLRTLNFSGAFRIKRYNKWRDRIKPKYWKYKIKSPISNYTGLQIKQLINHGHISLNNKKISSGNQILKLNDSLKINGFIPSISLKLDKKQNISLVDINNSVNILSNSFNSTIFLRRLKDKSYLNNLENYKKVVDTYLQKSWKNSNKNQISINHFSTHIDIASEKVLLDFIKHYRIKRLTEIFFMTYKNMHLLTKIYTKDSELSNNKWKDNLHIETHVKPLFDYMGYNQSIFILWPIISLLKVNNFSSKPKAITSVKKNILKFSNKYTQQEKNKLQTLLSYQRNLNKLYKTYNESEHSNELKRNNKSIVGKVIQLGYGEYLNNSNIFYKRSAKCYASLVYGTRVCKWVRFQQNIENNFYNHVPQKLSFFEWELPFFQNIIKYYKY